MQPVPVYIERSRAPTATEKARSSAVLFHKENAYLNAFNHIDPSFLDNSSACAAPGIAWALGILSKNTDHNLNCACNEKLMIFIAP